MEQSRFEELVREALASLPVRFARRLANIDVQVEYWPAPEQLRAARVPAGSLLLGLYVGVPQTRRTSGYSFALPDRIFIFQGPIERVARGDEAIKARVRRTVVHEVAHHFGWSDADLAEMEGG